MNRLTALKTQSALIVVLIATGCAVLKPAPPPPPYGCVYTETPVVVDGIMDNAWKAARTIATFAVPGQADPPISHTEARMLWDDQALYVFFKTTDRDIWALQTEHDDMTCREDVHEVFLKPNPEQEGYCHFEINALKTVYDGYVVRENTPMGLRWKQWNCSDIKLGTEIRGTMNDFTDADEYWTLEVAIPFTALPWPGAETPNPGNQWLFHLSRYDYSVYLEKGVELVSCAPLSKPAFHDSSEWILMQFLK